MKLIVVGAGVVGAACAYTASGLGADVVLVDADLPGQATAAGAGIICPWTDHADDPAWYAFACEAARDYPALAAELADTGDISYRQVGALIIAPDEREADLYCQQMTARRATARTSTSSLRSSIWPRPIRATSRRSSRSRARCAVWRRATVRASSAAGS